MGVRWQREMIGWGLSLSCLGRMEVAHRRALLGFSSAFWQSVHSQVEVPWEQLTDRVSKCNWVGPRGERYSVSPLLRGKTCLPWLCPASPCCQFPTDSRPGHREEAGCSCAWRWETSCKNSSTQGKLHHERSGKHESLHPLGMMPSSRTWEGNAQGSPAYQGGAERGMLSFLKDPC